VALTALGRLGGCGKGKSRTRRPTEDELGEIRQEFERVAAYPALRPSMAVIVDLAIARHYSGRLIGNTRWVDYDRRRGHRNRHQR
jgi:hypothetical protein